MSHLLRPSEAPNAGARRLREILKTRTYAQIARKIACDLSGVRRWALGDWCPDRRRRMLLEEHFDIPFESWDVLLEKAA